MAASHSDGKRIWCPNEQVWKQEFYRDGQKECKQWYANGKLWAHDFYRNGKLHGKRECWHENGQLSAQEFYLDGKYEGKRTRWYENGQPWMQEFYKNGELEGYRKYWYAEDAQLFILNFFRRGILEGECKVWHDNGHIKHHFYYVDGNVVSFNFSQEKKLAFLHVKRDLQHQLVFPIIDSFLISDLAKMVC